MRYAIWNNKGGVGKSFLTFTIASEYAAQNPEKTVYVIDMCPQANVSEMFLGGNGIGEQHLQKLLDGRAPRKTIGGYFDTRLASPHEITGNETAFPVNIKEFNESVPENMYLIAGDPSLEVQAEAINQIAGQTLPQAAWRNVHSWLEDMTVSLQKLHPDNTVFIDCNPSFSAYTELSIVAADKLIVPCTADGSSARAIDNIGRLVYATQIQEEYRNAIFSAKIQREGMRIPPIHMVILNRSTQYNKKASKAFGAMFDAIKARVNHLFARKPAANGTMPGRTFHDIPDTHSVTIVASHLGRPVGEITPGRYEVHGENPQVNDEPLERYVTAIRAAAELL